MARDLLRSEPVAREILFACDEQVRARLGLTLDDVIAEARIDDLRTSLPAIIAIVIALGRWLESIGVRPVALVGHSTGEIAAAHLAGALDLADTMQIICAYAETISACSGAMIHVDLGFDEAPRLFDELTLARADGSYPKLLARFARTDVLVIDDWGLAPVEDLERRDLLEIMEDRHGLRSTIWTSQLPVAKWHDHLGDPTVADAICDRLLHNAHRIVLHGPSRRKEEAKKD
jgi:hypothetical protein